PRGTSWTGAIRFRGDACLRDESTPVVEGSAEVAFSDRRLQDLLGIVLRHGEFRGEVLQIEGAARDGERCGVCEGDVACPETPRVSQDVQTGDEKQDCTEGRRRGTQRLDEGGPDRGEDPGHATDGQRNRRDELVPRLAFHAFSRPISRRRASHETARRGWPPVTPLGRVRGRRSAVSGPARG